MPISADAKNLRQAHGRGGLHEHGLSSFQRYGRAILSRIRFGLIKLAQQQHRVVTGIHRVLSVADHPR
ncbi:MAG: hypothetical protein QM775_23950 [Pirellulales bacterium]